MNYTKIIKKETKIMAVIVAVLTVLVTGASYAMFMRVNSSQYNQVVTTGDLRISYSSTNGYINNNTYPDIVPLTNSEGLNQTGYSFSVENIGSLPMTYGVYLYVDSDGYANDNPGGSLFSDLSSIKYNLETNNSATNNISAIGYQYKKTEGGIDKYEIYTGTLNSTNDEDEHVLKIWLDETIDVENVGKYVYLKLEVQGNVTGQREETNSYTVTFDANGGTLSTNSKAVVVGENYGNLPEPRRDGYTFVGWNGKNKFNYEDALTNPIVSTATLNDIDTITYVNGSSAEGLTFTTNFKPLTQYTMSGKIASDKVNSAWIAIGYEDGGFGPNENGSLDKYIQSANTFYNIKFTSKANATITRIGGIWHAKEQMYIDINSFQIEEGTEATEYEPYIVTSDTKVTQAKNHTLTAIWRANS